MKRKLNKKTIYRLKSIWCVFLLFFSSVLGSIAAGVRYYEDNAMSIHLSQYEIIQEGVIVGICFGLILDIVYILINICLRRKKE